MSATDGGLLFVYGEIGPEVTEKEFNDWYDDEHVPPRVAVPGFTSVVRYKAIDGKKPAWLAIYNTTSVDVITNPDGPYKKITPSDRDKSVISRLTVFNRRIYERTATVPHTASGHTPGKYLLVAGLEPKEGQAEDLQAWHKDEHWGLISKVPGFVQANQFSLVPGSAGELAGRPLETPLHNFTHLNLVEWDNDKFQGTPEFKAATETEWGKKSLGGLEKAEMRVFEIWKSWKGDA